MFTKIMKVIGFAGFLAIVFFVTDHLLKMVYDKPTLSVSREALKDGGFSLQDEWFYVTDAHKADGTKMSLEELKNFVEEEFPSYNIVWVAPTKKSYGNK